MQVIWDLMLTLGIVPLVMVIAAGVVALLSALVLDVFAKNTAQRPGTILYSSLLSAAKGPVAAGVLLLGAYLAAYFFLRPEAWYPYTLAGFRTLLALLGVYGAVAILGAVIRWYARELIPSTRTRLGYAVAPALRFGVPLAGGIAGLFIVLGAAGIQVEPVNGWLAEHGGRTAFIIVLVLVAILAAEQAIPPMVNRALVRRTGDLEEEARKRADTLARTLVTTGQVAATLIAIFMIIAEVGVNIGPVLAGVGVAGIAIGFGTQSLVRDFVGGFFILIENQYRIGDVIKVGEVAGLVEDLSLRRTVLRDLDGVVHSVPNGDIRINSNFTREWSRVNLNIAVAYGEDLDRVFAVINRVGHDLAQDPTWARLILAPPEALGVDYVSDTAVEIKILGDTKPIRQWEVMGELRKRLKEAFDQEGIGVRASQQGLIRQLAFPQRPETMGK